jgi:hypothetical protein
MFFDLDSSQGEWFPFFSSHIDPVTGEPIYDEPEKDAKVQIRSIGPFIEERMAKRKKIAEHVYNPKTRAMERNTYYADQTPDELRAERDDLWDYAITGIENFKDSKSGELITCTRENKLKLMKVPVFDRFVARCQQLLASSGVKTKEDEEKN